ncbi:MAG: exodeoxyribonuclease III [Tissierellales bacterium]|nr:exodeoxyribonuclease III [Tissierellales bacterium]
MRFISWNVNGLRAIMKKGFIESVKKLDPDILCLQETKMQEGQLDLDVDLEEYEKYFNSAQKKGYSGTAIFTKVKPISVSYGMNKEEHDNEGRIITAEYDDFYLVNVYTPNSKTELERLEYRMVWEDEFRNFLKDLEKIKPVIVCGDLNVAHKEIDLKNPSSNRRSAGFTDEERNKFTELLEAGFIDTFRFFYPDKEGAYTWWSYITKARERNAGWRIDYFLVSESLKDRLVDAKIHSDIYGSDHCPVELEIR